jgi:hypothetical protein
VFPQTKSGGSTTFGALTLLLGLGAVSGCGSADRLPTAPVTGIVTFDGKPLANAEIWLVPKSEEVKNAKITIRPYAKTRADGTFTVTSYLVDDGAPLGEYAIMVVPAGSRTNTEEERANDAPSEKKGRDRPLATFPAKYRDPTTSGQSFTVKDGPNQLVLDLKSK